MFEIPNTEQWKQIFSVSEQILKKAPWDTISEELIMECPNDLREEPFYITVHGLEEEVCGISVYDKKSDIAKFFLCVFKSILGIAKGDDLILGNNCANCSR